MASTAEEMVPCAVIMITSVRGERARSLRQGLEAVHAGEPEVEQDEVRLGFRHRGDRLLSGADLGGTVPAVLEQQREDAPDRLLVVDDQDAGHGCLPARGSRTDTVVPQPSSLSTSISPWCCSTMPWQIASPRPVPSLLVV